jgi:hypothetical protein
MAFQWFKEGSISIRFDIWNLILNIEDTHEIPTFKVVIHLRVLKFISLHSPTFVRMWLNLETFS